MVNTTETHEIRIVIADDHPIFRRGLKEVIESDSGLRVITEAPDGNKAIELIESLMPDVALLDIDMPGKNGFEVANHLRDHKVPTSLIFLTMYREEDALSKALELGVKGYVSKDSAAGEIVAAVRAVAAGQHYISPALSSFLVKRAERARALSDKGSGLNSLTPTELRVLKLIAEKKTSKEIAAELFVSPRTIDHHRASICSKLDLEGANALLKFALEHKADFS
jgi:DNA-binding NarL/FixJ family response regulator